MSQNNKIMLEKERYRELAEKEILLETYRNEVIRLTEEVRTLQAIDSIAAKKKFYKDKFVLDIEDYREARKAGMSNKEYAERCNISTRFLREKLSQEQIKTPPLTKEAYLKLKQDGANHKDIAKIYNMTIRTLYLVLNKLGVTQEERDEGNI